MRNFESWGRFPKVTQDVRSVEWLQNVLLPVEGAPVLVAGQGRSYGDSCLNDGGILLTTERLNRFISFDSESGILRCESGVTLAEIIEYALPRGWFLPVTPGTKFVSVGGAIANDVHGKNHHRGGTFGRYVRKMEVLRTNGTKCECSPENNPHCFAATVGGLGLTGFILWAEIQLKRVAGPYIDMESIKFRGLEEFFAISSGSAEDFEYTVAWLDCVGTGKDFARGIFMRGNHAERPASHGMDFRSRYKASVPIDFPNFALNPLSIRLFNMAYYGKQRERKVRKVVHYDPFFYPLDAVGGWNKIYGPRGFFQFQCVVPSVDDNRAIRMILQTIVKAGGASFLAVLKEFGGIGSPGIMSFPRAGVTLCLDFANNGEATRALLRCLDGIVRDCGGAIYPAKDAVMSPESFRQYFPRWEEFAKCIDPGISSSFWRRVTGATPV